MDRRLFPSNGRVAHVALQGQVSDVEFTKGQPMRVVAPVADLLDGPGGKLDRQLLHGSVFRVLESRGCWAFGFAEPSRYVGYVVAEDLADLP